MRYLPINHSIYYHEKDQLLDYEDAQIVYNPATHLPIHQPLTTEFHQVHGKPLTSLEDYYQSKVRTFVANIEDEPYALVTGGTGAGKSSQVPRLIWWFATQKYNTMNQDMEQPKKQHKSAVVLVLPRKNLISAFRDNLYRQMYIGHNDVIIKHAVDERAQEAELKKKKEFRFPNGQKGTIDYRGILRDKDGQIVDRYGNLLLPTYDYDPNSDAASEHAFLHSSRQSIVNNNSFNLSEDSTQPSFDTRSFFNIDNDDNDAKPDVGLLDTSTDRFTRLVNDYRGVTKFIICVPALFIEVAKQLQKSGYDTIINIFDEVHEHVTECDISISWCKKEKLPIVLITATADDDLPDIQRFFGKFTYIDIGTNSGGYHIDELYYDTVEQALSMYRPSINETGVVICPGIGTIRKYTRHIQQTYPDIEVVMYYSAVAGEVNINPNKHKPKIIVASPIVESSITIPNLVLVYDLGKHMKPTFFMNTVLPVTRSMYIQRRGRVGRTRDGTYIAIYRELWSDIHADRYLPSSVSFLYPYVYNKLLYNLKEFFCPPPQERLDYAEKMLRQVYKGDVDISKLPDPENSEFIKRVRLYNNPSIPHCLNYELDLQSLMKLKTIDRYRTVYPILQDVNVVSREGVLNTRLDLLMESTTTDNINETIYFFNDTKVQDDFIGVILPLPTSVFD